MSILNDESRRRARMAEAIAESWNRAGICHAVAHGLGNYSEGPLGRDLDVLVSSRQRQSALHIAACTCRELGWTLYVRRKPWVWWTFAFAEGAEKPLALEIDYITRLQWGPRALVGSPEPRTRAGPFWIDPWAAFTKRILIQLLGGQVDKLRRKPDDLVVSDLERRQVTRRLADFVGSHLATELLCALDEADFELLERIAPRLRWQLLRRAFWQSPLEFARTSVYWLRLELGLLFPKRFAPIIALVAPDGAGKSTVIAEAARQIREQMPFTDVVVRHWRPSLLPSLARLAGQPCCPPDTPVQPRRIAGRFHLLRIAYYLLDFLAGFWFKDLRCSAELKMLLYDRCALDMAVDPLRYGLSSAWGTRLLWKLIPKPDLVILLYDTPERIHARKPELTKSEMKTQSESWLQFVEKGDVGGVIRVDAGPQEVARRVNSLVVETFIRKSGESRFAPGDESLNSLRAVLEPQASKAQFQIGVHGKGKANPGWVQAATFRLFPSASNPRVLVPMHPQRLAAASLRVYNAQKPVARLAKSLLSVALRAGALRWLPAAQASIKVRSDVSRQDWKTLLVQEYLKEVFGRGDVNVCIWAGTPGVHQKPVMQVMGGNGEIIGYVKVGWNPATIDLVRNEEAVLRRLEKVTFSTAIVPKVVHAGLWNGLYLLAQEAPQGRSGNSPTEMGAVHIDFLLELQGRLCPRQGTVSEVIARLRPRIENLQKQGLAYYAHIVEWALERCEAEAGAAQIPLGFRHGDFTPYNTLRDSTRLLVFDWEYAGPLAPAGWDFFHFLIETLVLIRGRAGARIYADAIEPRLRDVRNARFFCELGVSREMIPRLLTLYLADVLSWDLCREGVRRGAKPLAVRNTRASLLVLSATGHLASPGSPS